MTELSIARRLGLALLVLLATIRLAHAESRRVALVIGESGYRNVDRLRNSSNDARLMATTLRQAGFTLVGDGAQLDLDKTRFDRAVQEFGRALNGADVALFYYSGHGMQVQGVNWLVPVDANPTGARDLDFQMVDASLVLRQMEGAGTKLNMMILDACRNNPFAVRGVRATAGGLAEMHAPEGTVISYATQPGNVADDGTGPDSPYTTALAAAIRQPGVDVFHVFNQVGLTVKDATGGAQQPWLSSSPIAGNFYFFTGPVTVTTQQVSDEAVFWQSVSGSRNSADFRAYLHRYPNGTFAELARQRLAMLSAPAPETAPRPAMAAAPGGPSRFDGTWDVTLSCDRASDGAKGYTFRYVATVQNGMFRGTHGQPPQADSLVTQGMIQPDGSAMLQADGFTGGQDYNVGKVMEGTPYHYHMQAHFDERQGNGTRLELRPCTARFVRQ
jgi:uncharacterized caspase-like protein